MINIILDDATGFQFNMLTTCKQYTTSVIQGDEVLITRMLVSLCFIDHL